MEALIEAFGLKSTALGHLTAAVQLGFIAGTLVFAIYSVADRFSPSKVFLFSALLGALTNICTIWEGHSLASLFGLRLLTGFFLAGIYPVGMKIASDYYQKGLGKSLGYLVGALVVGTALPHLLTSFGGSMQWKTVIVTTSALALLGGLAIGFALPDGPYRKPALRTDFSAFSLLFRIRSFRQAALGYFGHMWELYAFWAFVPVLCLQFLDRRLSGAFSVPFWSFLIIGIGGVACVVGGYASLRWGARKTAQISLLVSGVCCLLAPVVLIQPHSWIFLVFMLVWGSSVIADSPMFSTLVARSAPGPMKGTGLTIVNSAGFALTVLSIQLLNGLSAAYPGSIWIYTLLALGPLLGWIGLGKEPPAQVD
jgi:MFS family permease